MSASECELNIYLKMDVNIIGQGVKGIIYLSSFDLTTILGYYVHTHLSHEEPERLSHLTEFT